MPMHSIKQVIAEEEAAEEQDERTTHKEAESHKLTKKGSGSETTHHRPLSSGDDVRRNTHSRCNESTPKISSSDNNVE